MAPASSRLESILGAVARQRHCRWTSRPCPSCRAWLIHPRTGRRATLFVSWNAQIGSHQLPSSVARLHRLRSAGRHRWSHRHVARNACPMTTHACFVLGFAFCCRVLSRVSQVPILSASFWHYLHFLVQSARIFFACGGQKHSICSHLLIHRGPGPPLSREAAGVRHPVGGSHLSFNSRFLRSKG